MFDFINATKQNPCDVLTRCADMLAFVQEIMGNGSLDDDFELSKEAERGLCTFMMVAEQGIRGAEKVISETWRALRAGFSKYGGDNLWTGSQYH